MLPYTLVGGCCSSKSSARRPGNTLFIQDLDSPMPSVVSDSPMPGVEFDAKANNGTVSRSLEAGPRQSHLPIILPQELSHWSLEPGSRQPPLPASARGFVRHTHQGGLAMGIDLGTYNSAVGIHMDARALKAAHTLSQAAISGAGEQEVAQQDVSSMSTSQLRQCIEAAGMSHTDCVEKIDLQRRTRETQAAKQPSAVGRTFVIDNDIGSKLTPSCVAFSDADILIGEAAKKQAGSNPRNTLFSTKRFIGRTAAGSAALAKQVPYKVAADEEGHAVFEVEGLDGE